MHKKDFIIIADVVKQLPHDQRIIVAQLFADRLKFTNPQFNTDKFLKACEIN